VLRGKTLTKGEYKATVGEDMVAGVE